ncbi:MAG: chemotaxis protein CheC [Lachnospiraceae bacterium]|jgi:chemotaxis protein CheC|nr:chemotaxis protein CheC [Lachnospiraceae bacterium]
MENNFGFDSIDSSYLDALKEIGNIGAGNATTALAQMLQRKVDMMVPQADLLEFRDLGEAIGGEETIMAGVYMVVEGDINGSMMFLLEKESSKHLVSQMLGGFGDPNTEEFGEMELSVLKEMGNIMTGAYLNSLSDLTGLKIYPSAPEIAIDMAGAILSVPAIEFGVLGDRILMIQTRFTDDVEIDGFFILVPDLDSYHRIMESLGMA